MFLMLLLFKIITVVVAQEFNENQRLQYERFGEALQEKRVQWERDCDTEYYTNKASLEANGWALSGFTSHDSLAGKLACPSNSWQGQGRDDAVVSKTMSGSGFAILAFGNCGNDGGRTNVYLDGVEIMSAEQLTNNVWVFFDFTDGQVLELKGGNGNAVISMTAMSFCTPPKPVETCTESQNQQLRELLSDPVICFDDPAHNFGALEAGGNTIFLCSCVQSVSMTALAPFDCATDEGLLRYTLLANVMVSSMHYICANRKLGYDEIDVPGWQLTPAIKMYHYSSIPPVTLEFTHNLRFYKCMEICESDPLCKMFTVEKRGQKCIFNYCNSEESCAAEQPGSRWVSGMRYGESFSYVKKDNQDPALRECTAHCKQHYCQRSGNFLESSNRQMSCTQACYVRHYGSSQQKCYEQCDANKCMLLAKTFENGKGFYFDNCEEGDDSCLPTKQQCRAGCSNYFQRRLLTEEVHGRTGF